MALRIETASSGGREYLDRWGVLTHEAVDGDAVVGMITRIGDGPDHMAWVVNRRRPIPHNFEPVGDWTTLERAKAAIRRFHALTDR